MGPGVSGGGQIFLAPRDREGPGLPKAEGLRYAERHIFGVGPMLTTTTTALLRDLVDPANDAVWREFDARYRPVIFAFARRLGAGTEDAADLAQETLAKFVQEYRAGKYDRSRGRLRSWIIGIAKYRLADLNRARARRRQWRGDSALADLPDHDDLTEVWEAECRRSILGRAMTELRENTNLEARTIRAFEQAAFEERAHAEVAADLGMTVKDVVNAKHRCLKRLREIRKELQEAYDID